MGTPRSKGAAGRARHGSAPAPLPSTAAGTGPAPSRHPRPLPSRPVRPPPRRSPGESFRGTAGRTGMSAGGSPEFRGSAGMARHTVRPPAPESRTPVFRPGSRRRRKALGRFPRPGRAFLDVGFSGRGTGVGHLDVHEVVDHLVFTRAEWAAFVGGVRNGEFDRLQRAKNLSPLQRRDLRGLSRIFQLFNRPGRPTRAGAGPPARGGSRRAASPPGCVRRSFPGSG